MEKMALNGLTSRQIEVCALRFYDGLPNSLIALRLGISSRCVRRIISRARKTLSANGYRLAA